MTRPCKHCDSLFNAGPPSSKKVYCSDECHHAHKRELYSVAYRKNWPQSRIWPRDCAGCGHRFMARTARQRTCGTTRCGNLAKTVRELATLNRRFAAGTIPTGWRIKITCAECDTQFDYTTGGGARPRYCADCIGTHRAANRRAGRAAHKARKRAAYVETFDPAEILERDGWRCHLCTRRINPKLKSPHPQSATIDHIVPLARGGDHSRANVAAAHRRCNLAKGDRGTDQLRLVG